MKKRGWAAAVLAILAAAPAAAETRTYAVDPGVSTVTIEVGRAGLFKFGGHEHEVRAPVARGEVRANPDDIAASAVGLEFESAHLVVTGRGEPADDVPKVQQTMVGPKVLDIARFPVIGFQSSTVAGRPVAEGVYELRVTGDLTLRGLTRSLTVPLRVELTEEILVATGQVVLRQRDWGIDPVSAAGGLVKVKNELKIDVRIEARPVP